MSEPTDHLEEIEQRIVAACLRAGRLRESVTMVAVTKYATPKAMNELMAQGVNQFGERRPQQLVERVGQFPLHIQWHLIGHLQRNKVRAVLPLVHKIHSVDSFKLLQKISHVAKELSLVPKLLLEVNVSGEETKDGFQPSGLLREFDAIMSLENIQVEGLMTMAARSDDGEKSRPCFCALRELRDQLESGGTARHQLKELSMGMSNDFEVAIEEGATLIRIGTALY